MDEDELKGAAKDIGGKVKDAAGGLTGNEELQAEGKADQLTGKAQKLYGSAKESIGAAADAASEAFSPRRPDPFRSDTYSDPEGDRFDDGVIARAADMVRERPVLAMLGTAVAGYALALLLHGGSRRR